MNFVGQRRREKIAVLEAQARGLARPQSSNQLENGGVQLESELTTGSSSGPASEEYEVVEEVIQQPEVSGFPEMDFGQGPLDMQLFGDFSESSVYTNISQALISVRYV